MGNEQWEFHLLMDNSFISKDSHPDAVSPDPQPLTYMLLC